MPHLLVPTLGLRGPSCPVPQFPSTTGHFCPRRPWHSQAPGQLCAGAERQGSRCPRGVAISPGVPRETPLVLTAVPRYSGEALPGESLSHRRPHLPSPWRDPPDPPTRTLYVWTPNTTKGREEPGAGGSGKRRRAAVGARGARWGRGRPQPRRGSGSPGLSASSAGLCLACAREGDARPVPCPSPAPGAWIRLLPAPLPAVPLSEQSAAPTGGSRASPRGSNVRLHPPLQGPAGV